MDKIQLVEISKEELVGALKYQIKEDLLGVIKELKSNENITKEILTIDETAELFSVSKVTIHQWSNQKIIKRYKIGNRTYYRRSELVSKLLSSNPDR